MVWNMKTKRLSAISIIALFVTASLPMWAHSGQVVPTADEYVEVWGVQRSDNGYDFYARNDHFIPMYVNVGFRRLVSLAPSVDLPWRGAIAPGETRRLLFSLEPTARRGRIGYDLVYTFAYGDPETAQHDDEYLYLFPFAHGSKHRITQGHNGTFSHFDENQYAVDFDLDEGTAIHAAREGVVVRVKEDSRVGGPSVAYADRGNVVMVAHDDGSFGNYVHLMYRGAEVEVGDRVAAGQLIGYSGNTGISSGPHLHLDVRLPLANGRMQSIPFLFRGLEGEAVGPEEGAFYYAAHPGGAPFEAVFGADLTVADFADHRAEIALSNTIEFRAEEHDLTFAVFVGNGFPDPVQATIGFNLVNMRADTSAPVELTIPAGTELFVTLLRADPRADRLQYSPTVRYRRITE